MALRIAGKTAIVTGAGSGINLSFAKLLLQKSCNVLFADLTLRAEARDIVSQYSTNSAPGQARAVFQETDVTDWSQLDRMFKVASKEFQGVDIVCPGAGVYEPVRDLIIPLYPLNSNTQKPWSNFWQPPGTGLSRDNTSESRYKHLDINLAHPIRTTQLAIGHFIAHKRPGVITHISSIAAQAPVFPTPVYVATKHAISGFVRSLAPLEHPPSGLPKIRVNAVAPGIVKTPMWTEHPEKLKMVDPKVDEWVTPEEVAEVMISLVEKEQYSGGTILEVGRRQVRRVEPFNDPGPSGSGNTASNIESESAEIWERLKNRSMASK